VNNEMRHDQHESARQHHRHKAVLTHALRQQAGIPYEVEQKVCADCRRVLDERTLRRAAA
jgi:NMD protein affecting ribosome stability and mRNA decay